MRGGSSYLLIIVAAVAGPPDNSWPLLRVGSDEVYLRVVEDLVMLVRGELDHVELHHLVRRGHHSLWLQRVRAWVKGSETAPVTSGLKSHC